MGKICVLGASSVLGRDLLMTLAGYGVPHTQVYALEDRGGSLGEISYGEDHELKLLVYKDCPPLDFDVLFFALPAGRRDVLDAFVKNRDISVVLDITGVGDMGVQQPLGVFGVTHFSSPFPKRITCASSAGCHLLKVLQPIGAYGEIEEIHSVIHQSVSVCGREAMDELFNQTRGAFTYESMKKNKVIFSKQIAFNEIPHVGEFVSGSKGRTDQELRIYKEVSSVLGVNLPVSIQLHWSNFFLGSSQSIFVKLQEGLSVENPRDIFQDVDGLSVVDFQTDQGYVTPAEVGGEDLIYVSRIYYDREKRLLQFYTVCDAIHATQALNAVQIYKKYYDGASKAS